MIQESFRNECQEFCRKFGLSLSTQVLSEPLACTGRKTQPLRQE